jgi:hypothetical protein
MVEILVPGVMPAARTAQQRAGDIRRGARA